MTIFLYTSDGIVNVETSICEYIQLKHLLTKQYSSDALATFFLIVCNSHIAELWNEKLEYPTLDNRWIQIQNMIQRQN